MKYVDPKMPVSWRKKSKVDAHIQSLEQIHKISTAKGILIISDKAYKKGNNWWEYDKLRSAINYNFFNLCSHCLLKYSKDIEWCIHCHKRLRKRARRQRIEASRY